MFNAKTYLQISPKKVIGLIRRVCENITPLDWESYMKHVEKEEENYRTRDYIVDTEIEPFVIEFDDSSDDEILDDHCGVSN